MHRIFLRLERQCVTYTRMSRIIRRPLGVDFHLHLPVVMAREYCKSVTALVEESDDKREERVKENAERMRDEREKNDERNVEKGYQVDRANVITHLINWKNSVDR